jgi:hypothetical protein
MTSMPKHKLKKKKVGIVRSDVKEERFPTLKKNAMPVEFTYVEPEGPAKKEELVNLI